MPNNAGSAEMFTSNDENKTNGQPEMISVSLPEVATESQFQRAICNVIEPIKKDRATKEQMQHAKAQKNVSTRYFGIIGIRT